MAERFDQVKASQPLLPELFKKYLQDKALAQDAGFAASETQGDVVPYSATAAPSVDSKLAWTEARSALSYLAPDGNGASWSVPPDWPSLVSYQTGATAIPFCLGNYPQLVQDYGGLIDEGFLRPSPSIAAFSFSTKMEAWFVSASWQGNAPCPLMAAALLRLGGHLDRAEKMLSEHRKKMPKEFQAAWSNEAAALSWHRGQLGDATKAWVEQEKSAPIMFNRGLAALAMGQMGKAQGHLSQAIKDLPEDDAWHHLAGVYLALAEFQR
jgi:tetratricopeptide (TPR) repeat protein